MPHRIPLVQEVLRTFLADYLRIVEPDSAQFLRLDRIALPDLREVPGWTEAERSMLGVVAAVPASWGEKVTVVVQVEPEGLTPPELSRRLGRYFMDLEIHYSQPVLLNVVYLRGGRPGITLETAPLCHLCGMELVRLYFTTFALERARAELYLDRPEPLAWALSAAMHPVHHSRERHRDLCLERLAAAGLAEEPAALLRRFIDTFGGDQG
jgi:hypothetical protein